MNRFGTALVLLVLALLIWAVASSSSNGISVSCMMVYDEGGAPAVLDSDECPEWDLSAASLLHNGTVECQFAQLQGLRQHQEDRISCDLDTKIPLLGKDGLTKVRLGIAAVFDGHGGKEASETSSNLLSTYFYLHYVFKMYKLLVQKKGDLIMAVDKSLLLEVLKEALLSTIHDLDAKFTQGAFQKKLFSGSTATIVLILDGQILVANVGDSKALLFSNKFISGHEAEAVLSAVELTKDHHLDRDDERARIEAAGGSVIVWGVPRVNGILAMSRSLGDIYLKRYGVIAVPELTGWLPITANDMYLMVASDGIFESLSANDVCDLLLLWDSCEIQGSSSSSAEFIVNTAYNKGSTDNLSVILISLRQVLPKIVKDPAFSF